MYFKLFIIYEKDPQSQRWKIFKKKKGMSNLNYFVFINKTNNKSDIIKEPVRLEIWNYE